LFPDGLRHTSSLDNNLNTAKPNDSLFDLLFALARHPQRLLTLWNWKSASLSILLRGPIFLVAAVRHGWEAVLGALFAESIFCVVTAGFYGAIIQSLKDAQPQWLTGTLLAVVIPMIFQVLEYLLHWFRGTPHLRIAGIVSLIVGSISALFNWYAMRRGTLLVGGEGKSFGGDLLRLPILLLSFFAVLPRKLAAKVKSRSLQLLAGLWGGLFPGR
jgi:hypothetical protein